MMADAAGRDRPVTGVEREAAGVFDENAPARTRPGTRGRTGMRVRNIPVEDPDDPDAHTADDGKSLDLAASRTGAPRLPFADQRPNPPRA